MEPSFLKEIIADPANDDPRLIYADYLEEHGDPLGEFIRLQCELALMAGDEPEYQRLEKRQYALLKSHKPKWLGLVEQMTRSAKIYRGFIRDVVLGARQFIQHHEQLFALAPIQKATVVKVSSKSYQEFAECSGLGRLQSLKLSDLPLEPLEFRRLMESPYLEGLKEFSIAVAGPRAEFYRAIGNSKLAANVGSLDFSWNQIRDVGLVALLEGENLSELRRLACEMNSLSDAGVVALANCASIQKLRELHLDRNSIGPEGIAALGESESVRQLKVLSVNDNIIRNVGLFSLLFSENFARLDTLGIARNHLTDEGFTRIASTSIGGQLRHLDASHNELSSDSLMAIVNSPLSSLERLVWDGNRIRVVEALGDLIVDQPLRYLSLAECQLKNGAVTCLADSPGASSLRTLILSNNKLNDTAALSILESENLGGLTALRLDKNNISRDMQTRLRRKFGAGVCVFSRAKR